MVNCGVFEWSRSLPHKQVYAGSNPAPARLRGGRCPRPGGLSLYLTRLQVGPLVQLMHGGCGHGVPPRTHRPSTLRPGGRCPVQ